MQFCVKKLQILSSCNIFHSIIENYWINLNDNIYIKNLKTTIMITHYELFFLKKCIWKYYKKKFHLSDFHSTKINSTKSVPISFHEIAFHEINFNEKSYNFLNFQITWNEILLNEKKIRITSSENGTIFVVIFIGKVPMEGNLIILVIKVDPSPCIIEAIK